MFFLDGEEATPNRGQSGLAHPAEEEQPKALAEGLRHAKLGEAGEYSSYFPVSPNERNAAIAA